MVAVSINLYNNILILLHVSPLGNVLANGNDYGNQKQNQGSKKACV